MRILTYQEINQACLTVLNGSPHYSSFLKDAMTVLYYTGCRPYELMNRNLWNFRPDQTLWLQPLKGNNLRLVPHLLLPRDFMDWVGGADTSFRLYTYFSGQNFFKHTWREKPTYIGLKKVDQYIFRHRYVKYLKRRGLTDQEIKESMGWTNLSMVANYVNSVIYI